MDLSGCDKSFMCIDVEAYAADLRIHNRRQQKYVMVVTTDEYCIVDNMKSSIPQKVYVHCERSHFVDLKKAIDAVLESIE